MQQPPRTPAPPPRRDPPGAGGPAALLIIGGAVIGALLGQPTIGVLTGIALAVVVALAMWLATRDR